MAVTDTHVIGDYTAAVTIDGATHFMLIQPGSSSMAYRKISRNVLLGVTGQPADLTTGQGFSNKVLDNTNVITVKDNLLTLQDGGDVTRQAQFQLSSITPGQTRIYTLPDATSTIANLTSAQTFTNKTLTSPIITGGSITGTTITTDAIVGQSAATNGTVYGMSVTGGKISGTSITNATITSAQLANASVTVSKLATGAAAAFVATAESTTSTTYVDLTTVTDTVTVTIGVNGLAWISIGGTLSSNTGTALGYMAVAISGASTVAAADAKAYSVGAVGGLTAGQAGFAYLETGLTPGSTTFKLKYHSSTGANTVTASNRRISVVPL